MSLEISKIILFCASSAKFLKNSPNCSGGINNPIKAIDFIDEPATKRELSYYDRQTFDDGRLAVYLGRMRSLKFENNMVQLADFKSIIIAFYLHLKIC